MTKAFLKDDVGLFVPVGIPRHVHGSRSLSDETFANVLHLIEFSGQIPDCMLYMCSRGPLSQAQQCAMHYLEAEDSITFGPLTPPLNPHTREFIDRWWWDL